MSIKLLGKDTEERAEQLEKVLLSMLVKPSGRITEEREEQ